jgi:phosphoglucosamine mutase
MTEHKKYFGTDGIRGKAGESLINPEFVLKLGWAVGKVLGNGSKKKVVIGKDPRISSYILESVLQAGFSAAGVQCRLLGPMPTPAIAYMTQTLRAQAGIVISASHNLYADNGIKFFSSEGCKISDEMELAIERQLEEPLQMVSSHDLGNVFRIDDAPGRYIEFCKSTIPMRTRFSSLRIVIDCANGATYHIAPNVFRELGAEVIAIADNPDGFNINHCCGSTYPQGIQERVLQEKADLGIAFDGDGDRVIMVDHRGEVVDGDELLYIMAREYQENGQLRGGVVGTVMTNMGAERAYQEKNIPFIRTQVGDRYVLAALQQNNWLLGGESSGHIICLDKTTTGDGIVSALQVLFAMFRAEKNLHELKSEVRKFPQHLINLPCEGAKQIIQEPTIKQAVQDIENQLGKRGRILLRPSGTESLLRIMVEGEEGAEVKQLAQQLADHIRTYIQ